MYILDFTPPMHGMEGSFNTFRLGRKWASVLTKGDKVLLADRKNNLVIGHAKVLQIHTGTLIDMATQHAPNNHNQRDNLSEAAVVSLLENLRRRYGPHIATDNKLTTVIYLRRLAK